MSTLLAPLLGLLIGFLGAMPIGPLNVAVIAGALRGRARSTAALALGGALADFGYCSAAMLGLGGVLAPALATPAIRIVFSLAIVGFGLRIVLTGGRAGGASADPPAASGRPSFAAGFLISAFNPAVIVTWLLLSGALHASGAVGPGPLENLLFAAGAGCGMASWLLLLLYSLTRFRERIPLKALRIAVRCFGLLLVGFGVVCALGIRIS